MRQNLKDDMYFSRYFEVNESILNNGLTKLKDKRVNSEMINWYKKTLFDKCLYLTIASYSKGAPLNQVKEKLIKSVNYILESWDTNLVRLEYKGQRLNQYHSTYDEMLWMLSLGYLLGIEEADYKKLIYIIDRDGVKDFLFEFIIRAKLKNRQILTQESYQEFFGVPNCFEKLRQAIIETDKARAEKLVKEFITKEWYENHKETGWYDSHKSKHDTYFGYWSFETAAAVKIMGLDDSSFRDCPYYPKDLLDFDIPQN